MWDALAGLANTAINIWAKKEQSKTAQIDYKRRMKVAKKLAAEQLSLTYNSIAQRSLEVATQFKRQEFELRAEQRAAEGQVTAQAAQAGAMGNRASLAQKQATTIPAERKLAGLSADSKREQDALIRNADMEERAMINRLINNQPDAPSEMSYNPTSDIVAGLADAGTSLLAAYSDKKAKEAEKDAAIRQASSSGAQLQI